MKSRSLLFTTISLINCGSEVMGYAFISARGTPLHTTSTSSSLSMGLFDGVREAFSAPALIDKERETPIDRWMGWSVVSENSQQEQKNAVIDFIDSMDVANYVIVDLSKPMGIVFEENDADFGGIFVQSLKDGGVAFQDGRIREGDQLVAVDEKKVSGLPFDDALGAVVDSSNTTTKLIFFRGSAKQLYGPTGASQKWLEEFISSTALAGFSTRDASTETSTESEAQIEA